MIPGIAIGDSMVANRHNIGGHVSKMTANFTNNQYFNNNKFVNFTDLVTSARTEVKPAWLVDGSVGQSGHNLLTYSEELGDASLTSLRADITDNVADAPNGSVTADKISQTAGQTIIPIVGETVTTTARQHTYGCFGEADDRDFLVLQEDLVDGTSNYTWFNLSSGAVGTTDASHTASITSLGDGKYLCEISFLSAATTDQVYVGTTESDGSTTSTDDGKGINIWGRHLYQSDNGGMQPNLDTPSTSTYYPTTSTAYFAPVIAYDPVTLTKTGVVSEPDITRQNTYPECKDGTGWLDVGATSTNLALDVFDAFGGVRVESLGATWHRLKMSPSEYVTLAASNVYPFTFIYKAGDVTPSDEVRCLIENTTAATNSDISGAIGAVSITGTGAGSLSNVSEVLHADGETYILTGYITALANGDYSFDTGPNSTTSGETVIAVAAFIGGAGEKLPHCPIIGNDGFVETVAKDVMSFEAVPSEIELVTNGGFDDGIAGWNAAADTTLSHVSNTLRNELASGSNPSASYVIATVAGRSYRLVYESVGGTSSGNRYTRVGTTSHNNDIIDINSAGDGEKTTDFVATGTATWISMMHITSTAGEYVDYDNISVQELVPFVGYNGSEGTFVFKGNWVHSSDERKYMLAGDVDTRLVYQGNSAPTEIRTYDGTIAVSKASVFTDNTDTAVVMSYETGGNFDILADGSAEATASLTGDLATTSIDIGHLAGSNSMHGVVKEIVYYNVKLGLPTRQGYR